MGTFAWITVLSLSGLFLAVLTVKVFDLNGFRADRKRRDRVQLLYLLENLTIEQVLEIAHEMGIIITWNETGSYRLPKWAKDRKTSDQELCLLGSLLGSLIHHDIKEGLIEEFYVEANMLVEEMCYYLSPDQRKIVMEGCKNRHQDAHDFLKKKIEDKNEEENEKILEAENKRKVKAGLKACK